RRRRVVERHAERQQGRGGRRRFGGCGRALWVHGQLHDPVADEGVVPDLWTVARRLDPPARGLTAWALPTRVKRRAGDTAVMYPHCHAAASLAVAPNSARTDELRDSRAVSTLRT